MICPKCGYQTNNEKPAEQQEKELRETAKKYFTLIARQDFKKEDYDNPVNEVENLFDGLLKQFREELKKAREEGRKQGKKEAIK